MKTNFIYSYILTDEDKVKTEQQNKDLQFFLESYIEDEKEFQNEYPQKWIDLDRITKINNLIDIYKSSKFLTNLLDKVSDAEFEGSKFKLHLIYNDEYFSYETDLNKDGLISLDFYMLCVNLYNFLKGNTDIDEVKFCIEKIK